MVEAHVRSAKKSTSTAPSHRPVKNVISFISGKFIGPRKKPSQPTSLLSKCARESFLAKQPQTGRSMFCNQYIAATSGCARAKSARLCGLFTRTVIKPRNLNAIM